MDATLAYRAVFEVVEEGWIQGQLIELPGVITAAPTMAEAQNMIVDALAEYLKSFAVP